MILIRCLLWFDVGCSLFVFLLLVVCCSLWFVFVRCLSFVDCCSCVVVCRPLMFLGCCSWSSVVCHCVSFVVGWFICLSSVVVCGLLLVGLFVVCYLLRFVVACCCCLLFVVVV